jgi:UDP-GlcNAc:undecaprenyl-phosphate/decaprenyl-phosphate GlcNAc-1-phosphate transferase
VTEPVRYVVVFVVTFASAIALTPVAARLARRLDIQDRPAPNKFHQRTTPYLGGMAVVVALVMGCGLVGGWQAQLVAVLAGAIAMFALGLVDDVRTVSPTTKIVVQVGAALALWISGVRGGLFGNVADLPLTVLWVVGVTNALNLLDNMDGVLSGVTAISAFGFFVIAAANGDHLVGPLALGVSAASLGFLRFNFPPARIFLGDAGSLTLGFLLASIGLKLDLVGPTGFARSVIPVLILGVALFDTALVVVARVAHRRPVLLGSTDHTSHRLAALGLPGGRVAEAAYAAQTLLISIALWMTTASTIAVIGASAAVATAGLAAMMALLRVDPMRAGRATGKVGAELPAVR